MLEYDASLSWKESAEDLLITYATYPMIMEHYTMF
jgi:hypothetical protein